MKQIFIDTNILIFCALMTKEGHDSEIISSLTELLTRGKAEIILPEVVELEYYRKNNEVFNQVKSSISRLRDEINKLTFPNYIGAEKKLIIEYLTQLIDDRESNKLNVTAALDNLFKHSNVKKIALTPEIVLNAYRRSARGLKPFNIKNTFQGVNADCLIVESIKKYYENNKTDELFFCSNNTSDFALIEDPNGACALHPDIKKDISFEVTYYSSLVDLLKNKFQVELKEIEVAHYAETMKIYNDSFTIPIRSTIKLPEGVGPGYLYTNVYESKNLANIFGFNIADSPGPKSLEKEKEGS